MKVGGEYKSEMISPRHFEKLGEEAGFTRPLVKRRVPELAEAVVKELDQITIDHPVANGVAAFIKTHGLKVIEQFGD